MRPIDADKLVKNADSAVFMGRNSNRLKQLVMWIVDDLINTTPTIDAVPVVRCKDCKYYYFMECIKPENVATYWDKEGYDTKCYIDVELDHFCSYGERKTDGEDSKVL